MFIRLSTVDMAVFIFRISAVSFSSLQLACIWTSFTLFCYSMDFCLLNIIFSAERKAVTVFINIWKSCAVFECLYNVVNILVWTYKALVLRGGVNLVMCCVGQGPVSYQNWGRHQFPFGCPLSDRIVRSRFLLGFDILNAHPQIFWCWIFM